MAIARSRLFYLACLSVAAVAVSACSTASDANADLTSSSSELIVDPTDSSASVTIKSEDGACTDIRSLIDANRDALEGLCEDKRIPMPRASDANDCEQGQAKSITFECFEAKAPPPIASGCKKMPVNDRKKAIGGKARRHVPELPGLVCHRIGGWAGPSSHAPGKHPPMPPGAGPSAPGDHEGPPPPQGTGGGTGGPEGPGGPEGSEGGAGGPRPPMGGPGGGGPGGECKDEDFRPEIECCAPGFEDDYEGGPHPHGPPGSGEGPRPPEGGEKPAPDQQQPPSSPN